MGDLKKKYSAKCSVIELIGKPDYLLLIILFLTLFFHFNKIHAQINFENNLIAELEFDEIPVLVAVEGMENFYIDALFTDEDLLYLNFHELFLSLNLPCEYQQNREVLSGFIESADKKYKIDLVSKKLEFGNKILQLDNKMIIYDGNCFIRRLGNRLDG